MDAEAVEAPPPADARAFGTPGGADVDIYVDDTAMREAVGYAFSAREKLVLGVLVGDLFRWQGRTYTSIQAFIPARKAVSTSGSCKFTREAWEEVKQIRASRFPHQRIVGWMQSLPSFGVVITEMSASLHRSYFDLPHQVLLIVDPVTDDVGFFGWKAQKLERTGFYAFSGGSSPPRPASPPSPPPRPSAPQPPAPPPRQSPRSMPSSATLVPPSTGPIKAPPKPTGPRTFLDLLTEHGMAALHRQLHAADLLGKHTWSMDLDEGTVALGDHTFPVQVLGTAAEADETWLWGWANTASGIPEPALGSARQMQRLGEQHGIPELTEALVPLTKMDPNALALVATGVSGAAFFYRAAYEGGAAYLLIPTPGLGAAPKDPVAASTVITSFVADHTVNHRDAARHYVKWLGFLTDDTPTALYARSPKGTLVLEFDALNRITKVSVEGGK